ncbi:MAG: hypothetical protein EHM93_18850 [Bacteroidales bacterium]|nr:MAG: hypothetical protein EHM93_18850 [Bacteroidales bacterium]
MKKIEVDSKFSNFENKWVLSKHELCCIKGGAGDDSENDDSSDSPKENDPSIWELAKYAAVAVMAAFWR